MLCPCCSSKKYDQCCGPLIAKTEVAQSPEQLMRSRYTAYSLANIDYIIDSMRGKPLLGFNMEQAFRWARKVTWLGLEVKDAYLESDEIGFVEFIATILNNTQVELIHELSEFRKIDGHWFYTEGMRPKSGKVYPSYTLGRNSTCPCDSGKKFKNCHGK